MDKTNEIIADVVRQVYGTNAPSQIIQFAQALIERLENERLQRTSFSVAKTIATTSSAAYISPRGEYMITKIGEDFWFVPPIAAIQLPKEQAYLYLDSFARTAANEASMLP